MDTHHPSQQDSTAGARLQALEIAFARQRRMYRRTAGLTLVVAAACALSATSRIPAEQLTASSLTIVDDEGHPRLVLNYDKHRRCGTLKTFDDAGRPLVYISSSRLPSDLPSTPLGGALVIFDQSEGTEIMELQGRHHGRIVQFAADGSAKAIWPPQ